MLYSSTDSNVDPGPEITDGFGGRRWAGLLEFLKFGFSGFPAFLVAMAANWFFVSRLHWPKPAAYALVVWMQMSCGFLMCRYVVFEAGRHAPFWRAYLQFAGSMALIRGADWCFYTAAVEILRAPYLLAQIVSMSLFLAIKFFSAKAIFKKIPSKSR